MHRVLASLATSFFLLPILLAAAPGDRITVERFDRFESTFTASGSYANPYTDLVAEATLTLPEGSSRTVPLFWDGGSTWKLRVSPNLIGPWTISVQSPDPGLGGQQRTFDCVPSNRRGSLQPMPERSHHFQYQNGDPVWFLGDTAWALFTDNTAEKHHRSATEHYLQSREHQGFNVVHAMVLSEAGWGNAGGPPFAAIDTETINPGYWQEMDHRLAYANEQGMVVGLAIAWGDKRKQEPYAWRRFPNLEARQRYARYVAARYGAYNVYFLVAGEWHAEVRTRPSTEATVRQEFIEIGNALAAADPHDRMIGIHPMTSHGSVREFNDVAWMSFGDYQQNYRELHARALASLSFNRPVVNSEYGYHLRDQNGDGTPDKDNSTCLESIRHASWDIVMAGAYCVTGFGTTYFGGHRDPGPFQVDAPQNDTWEHQIGLMRQCFLGLDWWQLEPHDSWLRCATPRGADRKHLGKVAPPTTTYWLLADPGHDYLLYARGLTNALTLQLDPDAHGRYRVERLNPRTGARQPIVGALELTEDFSWTPPTPDDWVLHLTVSP